MKKLILVGYGKFAKQYQKELKKLELENSAKLVKILVKNKLPHQSIDGIDIESINDFNMEELRDIDGVIIVTPKETHFELIEKFAAHCHVLVEKPLAVSKIQLEKILEINRDTKYSIVPVQNFRFHPIVIEFKRLLDQLKVVPKYVEGKFINKQGKSDKFTSPTLEMIHFIDIIDYLYHFELDTSWCSKIADDLCSISVQYKKMFNANLDLGWHIEDAQRWLSFSFEDRKITLDFLDNLIIQEFKNGDLEKLIVDDLKVALQQQILNFLKVSETKDQTLLERAVLLVEKSICKPRSNNKRPTFAVIGAGIFGTNCAIELADIGEVDLFEKQDDLFAGATYFNQWRHHSGFHYPLSVETVKEIKETKKDFEKEYSDAIDFGIPAYYFVSSYGKEIPAERYLASCNMHSLNYEIVPTPDFIQQSSTSLCLHTDEGIYNIDELKKIVEFKISEKSSINVHLNSEVISGELQSNAKKKLNVITKKQQFSKEYDYVINCAYAQWNKPSLWFGLPDYKLRLEQVELVELELELDQMCLTFIDAPFLSLTSMGEKNKFLLSHRDHSVIQRNYQTVGKNEIDYKMINGVSSNLFKESNYSNIIKDATRYMPFLNEAKYVQSWMTAKAISAYEKEFWERPTLLKNHGFGYWSVLGGKILTSVTNAREISNAIKKELGLV